jgi:hypothetical protein
VCQNIGNCRDCFGATHGVADFFMVVAICAEMWAVMAPTLPRCPGLDGPCGGVHGSPREVGLVRAALVALKDNRNPDAKDRIVHSERDLGMSPGAVQVWFHEDRKSI